MSKGLKFRIGEVAYSQDGIHWFDRPFYGPERRSDSVVTKVDRERGFITIESMGFEGGSGDDQ